MSESKTVSISIDAEVYYKLEEPAKKQGITIDELADLILTWAIELEEMLRRKHD